MLFVFVFLWCDVLFRYNSNARLFRVLMLRCAQFLRGLLSRQPCERLLSSSKRRLLHEGPVTLLGNVVRCQ